MFNFALVNAVKTLGIFVNEGGQEKTEVALYHRV